MQKRVFRKSPFFFFAYDAHPWKLDSPPTWFKLCKISKINLSFNNFNTTCFLFFKIHNLLKACRPPESSLKVVPTLISRGEDKNSSKFCNIGYSPVSISPMKGRCLDPSPVSISPMKGWCLDPFSCQYLTYERMVPGTPLLSVSHLYESMVAGSSLLSASHL